ncbi:E3 SUMO-protein ligase SIZ1-like [Papaver somniferum]|uniref:E3 SUMO-protein ligase SIZ1-like n=1 Tax=Papaver somniferum TaxID=3469 RepID=UPI000E6FA96E|nr:E3 SUMO-protein ligase SIZ1-like [Papaver somniferum]XP_026432005.1 E3 SUMO-protein ligase SIZ1-like [Papaver somniferum]XP_026432006.1 E3 SUMO-protein ligase SIZ1-like [Papaver somniferum]XP_026432007.1 E3 SUMO-protein ligase SIZ1-like [Papaver somniferum]
MFAEITTCTREGMNKISLTGCDARIFCLGARIAKRRTVQQVLNLIPKELDGERFEDTRARVCRCIGGCNDAENANSDSDLEVVADSVTVNLCCPWQCPICLKNYTLEHMIIDPYSNRITAMMGRFGEHVTEIYVKPDGSWRANDALGQQLLLLIATRGKGIDEGEVAEKQAFSTASKTATKMVSNRYLQKKCSCLILKKEAVANKDKPICSHGKFSYRIYS